MNRKDPPTTLQQRSIHFKQTTGDIIFLHWRRSRTTDFKKVHLRARNTNAYLFPVHITVRAVQFFIVRSIDLAMQRQRRLQKGPVKKLG